MVVQSGDYYSINLEVKDKTEELVKISEDKKVFQSKLNKLCKVCQSISNLLKSEDHRSENSMVRETARVRGRLN